MGAGWPRDDISSDNKVPSALSPLKLWSRISRSLGALDFLANAVSNMQTVPERADPLDGGSKDTAMEPMVRDAKCAGARATDL